MVTGIGGMEIRTKFNINEKVYPISYYSEQEDKNNWQVDKPFEIYGFRIVKSGIYYLISIHEYFYAERNCFATKEEAQKECDRRNGKE